MACNKLIMLIKVILSGMILIILYRLKLRKVTPHFIILYSFTALLPTALKGSVGQRSSMSFVMAYFLTAMNLCFMVFLLFPKGKRWAVHFSLFFLIRSAELFNMNNGVDCEYFGSSIGLPFAKGCFGHPDDQRYFYGWSHRCSF